MRHGVTLVLAAAAAALILAPSMAPAQQERAAAGASGAAAHRAAEGAAGEEPPAATDGHAGGGDHGSPVVDLVARLFNFGILAGTLVYFLRSPLSGYLSSRAAGIRSGLANAAQTRRAAEADLVSIEARMAGLPAELEAIRKAGAAEVEAEEARIREAAARERVRLLDQARREIDWQVKIAQRDLTAHAAELAVGVAARRLTATITAEDQARLFDRYLSQLGRAAEPGRQVRA
ncbi:MAG TPA: ATP synthase F0 subunit B [Vicinamibacterales bacterium]|nr:ATP synthase F0 subunit B [Vicinamibacterales bacterium]HPW21025.1 ATP synthase F0 subunit B [Vicinamibacterales bacterium]